MPVQQLTEMSYGYESNKHPVTSGSDYEDVETIARIGTAEMNLVGKFEVFHQEVFENFYRLAGHIFSGKDLQKLLQENRPNFEWNLFLPIILSMVGNFKNTIPSIIFYGDDEGQEQGAALQKKLSDYFLTQANDIDYELAKAFLWAVVGRIGWMKESWSYDKDPAGMVKVEWWNSLRLKFDTNWTRRDTSDMRYMSDSGWYEASEIIDIYAKNDTDLRDEIYDKATLIVGESGMRKGKLKRMMQTWAERFLNDSLEYQGRKHGFDSFNEADIAYNYGGTWYNGEGRFKVVDWYEKRLEPRMIITDSISGRREDITDQVKDEKHNIFSEKNWFDRDKLQEIRKSYRVPLLSQKWEEVIWQTSIVPALNLKVYDNPQKIQCKLFKFTPVLCYDFHPDILETKSVMDTIIDPVSSYNMRRNTALTYIMKMAHGGWIGEESAVKGHEDELMSNELVGLKVVGNGALAQKRLQPIQPPAYPAALAEEALMEKEDLQLLSSQPNPMLGKKETSRETASLNQQRIQQANILQTWLADNACSALLLVCRFNLAIAQKYLKLPRVLPFIHDENDVEWIKLNYQALGRVMNDVDFGKYSVKVSKMPAGKKGEQAESDKMMQYNNWLMQFDKNYVDVISTLENSGLTNRFKMIAHIKQVQQKVMQEAQQQQQQQQQQQKEMQDMKFMQKAGMKVDLLKHLNELHKGTLENRQMSGEIADSQLQNNFINQN